MPAALFIHQGSSQAGKKAFRKTAKWKKNVEVLKSGKKFFRNKLTKLGRCDRTAELLKLLILLEE